MFQASRGKAGWLARAVAIARTWVDSDAAAEASHPTSRRLDWARFVPFLAVHLGALGVFWVGVSWAAVGICVASYGVRMFGITAFFHRGFAHRAFRAPRFVQLVGAVIGNAAAQRGPLWWAAHHRKHHKFADTPADVHSPAHGGFLWCHIGWWTDPRMGRTDLGQVRDLAVYPELRWLDRFDSVVPIVYAAALFGLGALLAVIAPSSGLDAWQCLVWGFFVSTVALYHATFTINSLCHRFGSRRYATNDDSRNNAVLALLTLGEGWHNNHHHYPVAARQGFFWWELDISYAVLRLLELAGLVSDLRPVPLAVRDRRDGAARAGL